MSMAGSEIEALATGAPDACPFRLAKPRHGMRERIQHRLKVEGRPADDLQLVGEGCEQLDLLVTEWPHRRSRHIEHTHRDALPHHRYTQQGANACTLDRL